MPSGHEPTDANPVWIAWGGVALTACAAAMFVVLHLMFKRERGWQEARIAAAYPASAAPVLVAKRGAPPEPRLQRDPRADFERYRDEKMRLLDSYQWIDEKAGIARIPIKRAMEILSNGS